MINSTTSTDRAVHPEAVAATGQASARVATPRPDQLSTENAAHLRDALLRQPEIRADVVERARGLAADPSYPTIDILKQVGAVILNSTDLSELQS